MKKRGLLSFFEFSAIGLGKYGFHKIPPERKTMARPAAHEKSNAGVAKYVIDNDSHLHL